MMKRSLATKNLCKLSSTCSSVIGMETAVAAAAAGSGGVSTVSSTTTTVVTGNCVKPKNTLYLKHDTSDYSLDLLPTFYAARDECWDKQLDELIELFANSTTHSSSSSSTLLSVPPRITMNFIQHMLVTSRV